MPLRSYVLQGVFRWVWVEEFLTKFAKSFHVLVGVTSRNHAPADLLEGMSPSVIRRQVLVVYANNFSHPLRQALPRLRCRRCSN
jgi:hypothetical protein